MLQASQVRRLEHQPVVELQCPVQLEMYLTPLKQHHPRQSVVRRIAVLLQIVASSSHPLHLPSAAPVILLLFPCLVLLSAIVCENCQMLRVQLVSALVLRAFAFVRCAGSTERFLRGFGFLVAVERVLLLRDQPATGL